MRALQPLFVDLQSNADVLSDPFYAPFVGRALALSQPSDELLGWVHQHAPLALISSLRFLQALPPHTADRLADSARQWLESASKDEPTPPIALFEAYRLLEGIDTPYLLGVTQSLPWHRLLARARLANGDAAVAIAEFADARRFAPAVNDRSLDAALNRAIYRHKQKLVAETMETLQRPDLVEGDRLGALVLAGFIADRVLAAAVRTAWDLALDKSNALLPALWAGLRCATADPARILDGMMAAWAALPDDEMDKRRSDRAFIAQELQFAVPRGISESVLKYLIEKARENDSLRGPITSALMRADDPTAITFLVEAAAEIERRIKGTDSFSPWLMLLMNQWDATRVTRGRRLPPEAVHAIRSLWESETADPQLRETAFKFWLRAVDDLDVLRSVPSNHPQFESMLWRRASLGDLSTIPWVKQLLATNQNWFRIIAKIWSEQFKDVLNEALQKLATQTLTDYTGGTTDAYWRLAELLRDMPACEAQPFLVKYWDRLKFSRVFVQAALYIGSPECVALAAEAIGSYPSNADPFEHVGGFFGFFMVGLADRLQYRHLEVLLPYLGKLSSHTLGDMAEFCERHDYCDWGRVHLKLEIDRRRAELPQTTTQDQKFIEHVGRHHFPSDADLLQELDWIEQQGDSYHGHLYHWLEEFERRKDDHARWQRILDEWLFRKPTSERFRLFADAVSVRGTRGDIDLLYKYSISGDPSQTERLRANARIGIMRRSLQ